MGSSQSLGLERNFCKELTRYDMLMLRKALGCRNPSIVLKKLSIEAYEMPYYVEYRGSRTVYFDLLGAVKLDVPAESVWK